MNEKSRKSQQLENGTVRVVDGRKRIYVNGYWIVYYPPPRESLEARKNLITNLTRRAFHHTEPGINTPGTNLELARKAYEQSESPEEKRVNAAMLAGALFNRATDIFTKVVELNAKGVNLGHDDELMKQCSNCLQEAMEFGKSVRHYSGMEGIDELWGEPLKAFTMPISKFYMSRYTKISLSMRDIDHVADTIIDVLNQLYAFHGIEPKLKIFAEAAKRECELIKTDETFFYVWPRFVTASDTVKAFAPEIPPSTPAAMAEHIESGSDLLQSGRRLITYIAGARVPITNETRRYLKRCERFAETTKKISGS